MLARGYAIRMLHLSAELSVEVADTDTTQKVIIDNRLPIGASLHETILRERLGRSVLTEGKKGLGIQ